jgi:hypothetical protein
MLLSNAMNRTLFTIGVALSLCHLAHAGDDVPPAIAVTIEGGDLRADWQSYPRIMMAVWPDGKIIWSQDQTKGGPPFRVSRIEPAKTQALLTKFEKQSVFQKDKFRHSWLGLDSTYHSIWLSSGAKHIRVETWHELWEANPDLVVIHGNVTTLEGRKRDDVIASDTKEFQAFRKLWTDLRTSTSSLIPKKGTPLSESLKLKLPK